MALTKAHNRMIEGAAVNVKDFGAVGDGVISDTAAIQAAIDYVENQGGGVVFLPKGVYLAAGLIQPSKVILKGVGPYSSEIKRPSGAAQTIILSKNFSSLTNQNKWLTSDGVQYGLGLQDIGINGNKSGGGSGSGVKYYAKNYIIDNVIVFDCPNDGFYSEAGAVTGQTDYTDLPESGIKRIQCRNNDGKGFHFKGPHNSKLGQIISAYNGDYGVYFDSSANYDGNADEVDLVHSYANSGDKGIYINTTIAISRLICDGDNLKIESDGNGTRINRLKVLNGGGLLDAINIIANNVAIDDCFISLTSPSGATARNAINVSGDSLKIGNLYIAGNSESNNGLNISGNKTQISALEIIECNGDSSNVAIDLNGSNSFLSGFISNCSTAFDFSGGLKNRVSLEIFTASGQSAVTGNSPSSSDHFDINSTGDDVGATSSFIESGTFSLDSTGNTSFTLNHGLLYTPDINKTTVNYKRSTNVTDVNIGYMRVASVNSTSIVVQVGVATASATAGSLGRLIVGCVA